MPRPTTIPLTKLRHFYNMLSDFASLKCHMALSEEAVRPPTIVRLAATFERSVEHFEKYDNSERFYPSHARRTPLPDPKSVSTIARTEELASLLQAAGTLHVDDHPELSFRYVDREIVPARTTGAAIFEDGTAATRTRHLDVLLANALDSRLIIGEVKIRSDKNPFYAVVQSLMYAAELVTENQLKRVEKSWPNEFAIPQGSDRAVADVYILLSQYNLRSPIRRKILENTQTLCRELCQQPSVAKYLHRITCLNVIHDPSRNRHPIRITTSFS